MTRSLILAALLLPAVAVAQSAPTPTLTPDQLAAARVGLNTLTEPMLRGTLGFLASDELEGRETAMRGQKIAARFVASEFERLGLVPMGDSTAAGRSYLQSYPVEQLKLGATQSLVVTGARGAKRTFAFRQDFYTYPRGAVETGAAGVSAPVVFVGYGITDPAFGYDDYAGLDVRGKIVLMLGGEPQQQNAASKFNGDKPTKWMRFTNKVTLARENGAVGVLIVNDLNGGGTFAQQVAGQSDNIEAGSMRLVTGGPTAPVTGVPYALIDSDVAAALLDGSGKTITGLRDGIDRSLKLASIPLKSQATLVQSLDRQQLTAENVTGLLPGSDPALKDEVMVISAHLDHIGMTPEAYRLQAAGKPIPTEMINNGADDDGSGSTALLALARAYTSNPVRPRRSILFLNVTGEEKGLLGSSYFSDHPTIPVAQTVADLNVDMIGRNDEAHESAKDSNYVYIIGSDFLSTQLHQLNEAAATVLRREVPGAQAFNLDYRYNNLTDPEQFYFRSDHYNFAKKNIPIIFYFNGVHADYHRPGDEVEKIDFRQMLARTKLVYLTGWFVANADHRPVVDKSDARPGS